MAGKTNFAEGMVLDYLLGGANPTRPTSRTVHLYTANPTDAGGGTEVSTDDWTNYAAQTATFSAAGGDGAVANDAEIDFGTATTTGDISVTGFGIQDHLGNLLYWAAFGSTQIVQNGNPVKFAVGDLDVTED
ncbi:MAG: phage tail fiber protein [Actinomycetota bacterium]